VSTRDPETGWIVPGASAPEWMQPLVSGVAGLRGSDLTRFLPPTEGARPAAVLMLLGDGPEGPDVLLIERAHDMRSHAGQPAFPGGALEVGDQGPIAAATREAREETGLDPSGVEPVALLPDLWVPVSDFIVTPVLAWWQQPSPVSAADPTEVASVHRVPIAHLADPTRRMRVRHPSGYVGMGFDVAGLRVWGFTAGLIAGMLDIAGWSQPWDDTRIVDLDGYPRLGSEGVRR
jgi:8-oxo-dGTP pyrophosphatase MutT (NUDIX family)